MHLDIESFMDYAQHVKRLSANTIKSYRIAMHGYTAVLLERGTEPAQATVDDMSAYLSGLSRAGASANTMRVRLAALKGLHTFLHATGRSARNESVLIGRIQKTHAPPRHDLSRDRLDAMRAAARTDRQRLLIALMYDCALRASESVTVTSCDLDLTSWQLIVQPGKTKRGRIVPVSGTAARSALADAWRHSAPGERLAPVTYMTARRDIATLATAAGLDPAVWTPHALRHARAEHLRATGLIDPFQLAAFLGHESPTMTQHYVSPASTLPVAIYDADVSPGRFTHAPTSAPVNAHHWPST